MTFTGGIASPYRYDTLPERIEISSNNRAKCRNCFKKVIKGTPRSILRCETKLKWKGKEWTKGGKAYFCYECIDKNLKYLIEHIRDLKKEHRKLNNRKSVKKTKILLSLESLEEREPVKPKLIMVSTPMGSNPLYKLIQKGGKKWKKNQKK